MCELTLKSATSTKDAKVYSFSFESSSSLRWPVGQKSKSELRLGTIHVLCLEQLSENQPYGPVELASSEGRS
jgi:hypothetical protein